MLMGISVTLFACIVGLLIWRVMYLAQLVARMRDELAGLVDAAVLRGPDAAAVIGPGRPTLITIEILNHFELAKKENRLAGHAAVVAPELIRMEVTRQAIQRVKVELLRQGVKADVRVVRSAAD